MKYNVYALVIILFMGNRTCLAESYYYNQESGWYENAADYALVEKIKARSDLSQSDVDKFDFLRLGRFQDVAAAGIGAYATYKGGTGIHQALGAFGSYGPSEDNKFWWALAGAAGIGFGAYKVLYPRLASGMLQQIKTYVDMCENLDVYNFQITQLSYLGTSQQNAQGVLYKPEWNSINAAWHTSNIARKKGMDNLLAQGSAAIKLISKLETTDELRSLNASVVTILERLAPTSFNYQTIEAAANQEAQTRAQKVAAGQAVVRQELQIAQNKANVQVAEQKASALWYGKISLALATVSNVAQNTLNTLTYIYENKKAIAGGIAAIYFFPTILRKAFELQQGQYSQ